MSTYDVTVTRDGRHWMIQVPAIDRVTQARRLREVDTMATDLIHIMTGEPADSIEVRPRIRLSKDVDEMRRRSQELRDQAAAAQAEAAALQRATVLELVREGLTMRDIGQVMGFSHQRAQQLADEGRELASR